MPRLKIELHLISLRLTCLIRRYGDRFLHLGLFGWHQRTKSRPDRDSPNGWNSRCYIIVRPILLGLSCLPFLQRICVSNNWRYQNFFSTINFNEYLNHFNLFFPFLFGCRITGAMGICFPYLGEFQPTKYREKILCWMEMFWTVGVIILPRKFFRFF